MMNYSEALNIYLSTFPNLKNFLYFNSSENNLGHTSMISEAGGKWEKQYVRGHGIKSYDFAIVFMGRQDSGANDINSKEFEEVEKFMKWIDEQDAIGNYPVFEGAKVFKIENLQDVPTLASVDQSGNVAKFMFQARVLYTV